MSKPESLDDLIEMCKSVAKSIGDDHTEPDDDWMHQLVSVNNDREVSLVMIDAGFFANEISRMQLRFMIAGVLKDSGAVMAAALTSNWVSSNPGYAIAQGLRPRDDPDHFEQLSILAMSKHDTKWSTARMNRFTEGPPTLEEWVDHDSDGAAVDGLVPQAIRAGLC